MTIKLYHHPFSRASSVVWMLEEVGVPYELEYVDLMAGAQKKPEFLALNPMGKLPTLVDGAVVATESAAIGLYLADRYSHGKLAPALDDPARATYFRWATYPAAVIEPGSIAKLNKWEFKSSQVGWGDYSAMLDTIERAVSNGDYLLGDRFTMADAIFGGTLRYMLRFNMVEARPAYRAYVDRLNARPALVRSDEINARIAKEHNLG